MGGQRGECVCVTLQTIDVKVDTQGCGLGEDVDVFRFELTVN